MFVSLLNSDDTFSKYDIDKLYTIQKVDADHIVEKALLYKPDLFKEKYQIGVVPNTNTVFFWKKVPEKINSFETKDMVFAVGVQVSKTDKEVCRVCAEYITEEEFKRGHIGKYALDGFEIEEACRDKISGEIGNSIDFTSLWVATKVEKQAGIEKQDLEFVKKMSEEFGCIDKDARVNDKNDFLVKLWTLGNFEETEPDEYGHFYMVNKVKPQYVYKAYNFFKEILGNRKDIDSLRYDLNDGKIKWKQFVTNRLYPDGRWEDKCVNVINNYIMVSNAWFDLNSQEDRSTLKQAKDITKFYGDNLGCYMEQWCEYNHFTHQFKDIRLADYRTAKASREGYFIPAYYFDEDKDETFEISCHWGYGYHKYTEEEYQKYYKGEESKNEWVYIDGKIYPNNEETRALIEEKKEKWWVDHPDLKKRYEEKQEKSRQEREKYDKLGHF